MQNIIGLDSLEEKNAKFSKIMHLFNEENLKICFKNTKNGKKHGVDLVTKIEYSKNIDRNIIDLINKINKNKYIPKPVKRTFISKDGTKTNLRPLGIISFEDKIVQKCIQEVLMYIYKPVFKDCMYGIGKNKSCHNAISSFNRCIMKRPINYVVEVDIRSFFDNINHIQLIRFLNKKILDNNLLKLIFKFLKAGIIKDNVFYKLDIGTPQGSSISSILANVYLHYIIDSWFYYYYIKQKSIGYMKIIRYCDDFVVCCQKQKDALDFLDSVKNRLNKFGLDIATEKTRIINFGIKQWNFFEKYNIKIKEFDFLGFTHYAKKNKFKKWIVIQKTSEKNINRKLLEITNFIKKKRRFACLDILWLDNLWEDIKSKLRGYINYFAVYYNIYYVKLFIKKLKNELINLFKNKQRYIEYIKLNPLPKINITKI